MKQKTSISISKPVPDPRGSNPGIAVTNCLYHLDWLNHLQHSGKSPAYKLLRVVAVLTARDDGSEALGVIVNGKVTPAEPHLKNPSIHLNDKDNYITDWINLANKQLRDSYADFGLDVENIVYTLEKNTILHTRECGDNNGQFTENYFKNHADTNPNSPYPDSVIIVFRWGRNTYPDNPTDQGCSDVTSSYILMPGKYRNHHYVGGQLVYGNNHLTHELGHFMGLTHTFSRLQDKLAELVGDETTNPKNLPLTETNLPELPGMTKQDIIKKRDDGLHYIATWRFSLDQDTGGRTDIYPNIEGVSDTSADLGIVLPLLMGHMPCQGSYTYDLDRYHYNDLVGENEDFGEPKEGAQLYKENIIINDDIRLNAMSYWPCDPENMRFSMDQVTRMNYVLDNHRQKLVNRTIYFGWPGLPWWLVKFPCRLRKIIPWEPIIRILTFPIEVFFKGFLPKKWGDLKTVYRN